MFVEPHDHRRHSIDLYEDDPLPLVYCIYGEKGDADVQRHKPHPSKRRRRP